MVARNGIDPYQRIPKHAALFEARDSLLSGLYLNGQLQRHGADRTFTVVQRVETDARRVDGTEQSLAVVEGVNGCTQSLSGGDSVAVVHALHIQGHQRAAVDYALLVVQRVCSQRQVAEGDDFTAVTVEYSSGLKLHIACATQLATAVIQLLAGLNARGANRLQLTLAVVDLPGLDLQCRARDQLAIAVEQGVATHLQAVGGLNGAFAVVQQNQTQESVAGQKLTGAVLQSVTLNAEVLVGADQAAVVEQALDEQFQAAWLR